MCVKITLLLGMVALLYEAATFRSCWPHAQSQLPHIYFPWSTPIPPFFLFFLFSPTHVNINDFK
jgi:hypothetical protein